MHLAFILMLFCYCCGGFIILLRHVVLKRRRARERERECVLETFLEKLTLRGLELLR